MQLLSERRSTAARTTPYASAAVQIVSDVASGSDSRTYQDRIGGQMAPT